MQYLYLNASSVPRTCTIMKLTANQTNTRKAEKALSPLLTTSACPIDY